MLDGWNRLQGRSAFVSWIAFLVDITILCGRVPVGLAALLGLG